MLHELPLLRGLKGEKVFHRDLRPGWDCERNEVERGNLWNIACPAGGAAFRNHPVSASGTDTPPGEGNVRA